jgi:predicted DNA-binding protein with PD1-like motif
VKTKQLARRNHLLVLDTGDEVIDSLTEFAKKKRITGGSFSGIGAFQRATVAYWNRQTKKYEPIDVNEQVEVLTISGSIARSGSEVKIHAHAVLGRRSGSTIAGHVLKGTVLPTLELFVVDYGKRLTRSKDAPTGLWLLDLK